MADSAASRVLGPIPEEPSEGASQPEEQGSPQAADQNPKIPFGTFLEFGPTRYRNVTVAGYDKGTDTVIAYRRSGDGVSRVNIPRKEYEQIEALQQAYQKRTGRKQKKFLHGFVGGLYGKNLKYNGENSRVIGYDGQRGEVLMQSAEGKASWVGAGDVLASVKSGGSVAKTITGSVPAAGSAVSKPLAVVIPFAPTAPVTDSTKPTSPSEVVEHQTTAEELAAAEEEAQEQEQEPLSPRDVERLTRELKPVTVSTAASVSAESVSIPSVAAPSTGGIRQVRQELAQTRTAAGSAARTNAEVQIDADLPSAPGAITQAAVVTKAKVVVKALGSRIGQNQAKSLQINAQISDMGGRISDIDRRIQQAPPNQVAELEAQAEALQEQRRGLQNQLTTVTVQISNDRQTSDTIQNALDQVASYPPEKAPTQVIQDLRSAIPPAASLPVTIIKPTTEAVGAAAAALRAPAARIPLSPAAKQFFDQNRPSASRAGGSIPIQAVKPPLRALPEVSTEARRATQLNRGQAISRRRSERPTELGLTDALEEAMATEGALPGYSGVLDIPEGHAQSYAAGAKNEPEEADIYGKSEEEQRIRQASVNRRGAAAAPSAPTREDYEAIDQGTEPGQVYLPQEEEPQTPEVSEADQAARFAALSSALAQSQMQEEEAAGEVKTKETFKEKTLAARRLVSRAVDVFDAAHGGVDGIGIVLLLLNENAKLIVTLFGADFYLLPKLSMPLEAGLVIFVDILIFAVIVVVLMIFVIIIAALYSAAHPGEAALQAFSTWLSSIF